MKIALVTLAHGSDFQEMAHVTRPGKLRYCQRHGYEFREFDGTLDVARPASWSKIVALREVLPQFDWVCWLDCDTVAWNPLPKLERFIDECEGRDLILQRSPGAINCGMFLLRNCPWADKFLQAVYSHEECVYDPWWEQTAFIYEIADNPAHQEHIHVYGFGEPADGFHGYLRLEDADKAFVHLAGIPFPARMEALIGLVKQSPLEYLALADRHPAPSHGQLSSDCERGPGQAGSRAPAEVADGSPGRTPEASSRTVEGDFHSLLQTKMQTVLIQSRVQQTFDRIPADDATAQRHRRMLIAAKERAYEYPADRFSGRGIVICGGGPVYFVNAWVCINILRHLGCRLPIEVWHLGSGELTPTMRDFIAPLGVRTVDAWQVREQYPVRVLNGWELKPYAIMHSRFAEVLYLDADNVPLADPEYLFDAAPYLESGAVLWPDFTRLTRAASIWRVCGVPFRDEPEVESGQIVLNKRRCWRALQIAMHLNEYSDYYYLFMHGDKETFHMAWHIVGQEYAMPVRGIEPLDGVMCQHDFQGKRVFQHRNMCKWRLGENPRVAGFVLEEKCLDYLSALERVWPELYCKRTPSPFDEARASEICKQRYFVYCRVGYDCRPMELLQYGVVGDGAGGREREWYVQCCDQLKTLVLSDGTHDTCRLLEDSQGVWRGAWLAHEQMPIILAPVMCR